MGLQFLELNELCSLENEIRRRIFSSHFSIIWCNFSGLLQHFVSVLKRSLDCRKPRDRGSPNWPRNYIAEYWSDPIPRFLHSLRFERVHLPKLPKLRGRPTEFHFYFQHSYIPKSIQVKVVFMHLLIGHTISLFPRNHSISTCSILEIYIPTLNKHNPEDERIKIILY